MNRAIVIGGDSENALSLVQCLGREGVYVIAVLVCSKSELIKHSKFVKEIFCVEDNEKGIDFILERCVFDKPAVLLAASDGAALTIERNKNRIEGRFLYEYIENEKNIEFYMHKQNQVAKAIKFDFNVPYSVNLNINEELKPNIVYPCIVKPLISCEGDKRDICVASNQEDLYNILRQRLQFTKDVIIQQFIDKDYEYNMMGCSYKDGSVYIPLSTRKVKFNHYLNEVSTISYVETKDPHIATECIKVKKILNAIGYVGLFSVEFMHSKGQDKIYFTEINFRNDGLNSFIMHSRVNLPFLHYQDLCGMEKKKYIPEPKSKKYIYEGTHFLSLLKHEISFKEWLSDIMSADGCMYYFKDDKWPFFYEFANKILSRLHII